MKVRATKQGFYGKMREAGEEFEIANKADLGKWMEPVKATRAKPKKDEGEGEGSGEEQKSEG